MQTSSAEATVQVTLYCPYCGHDEPLPEREELRVRALAERLRALGRARAEREAVLLRFVTVWQRLHSPDSRRGLLGLAAAALYVTIMTARSLPQALASPLEFRAELTLGVLEGPLLIVAACVASLLPYAWARRRYLRDVRPLLAPRPPASPQAGLRCRMCAGELNTHVEAAAWLCPFCGTTHIPGQSHADGRMRLYEWETDEARDHIAQADAALAQAVAPGWGLLLLWIVAFAAASLLARVLTAYLVGPAP